MNVTRRSFFSLFTGVIAVVALPKASDTLPYEHQQIIKEIATGLDVPYSAAMALTPNMLADAFTQIQKHDLALTFMSVHPRYLQKWNSEPIVKYRQTLGIIV